MQNIIYAICIVGGLGLIFSVLLVFFSNKVNGNAEIETNEIVEGINEDAVAKVKCYGTSSNAKTKYIYDGIIDCTAANNLSGGDKICAFACLGLGTCVKVCPVDAIRIVNGIAEIDKEICNACGKCAKICPKNVISIIPRETAAVVECSSQNHGQIVEQICEVGCNACGVCVNVCPVAAIKMENNLAIIDREKCTNCGVCVEKCPREIIMTY